MKDYEHPKLLEEQKKPKVLFLANISPICQNNLLNQIEERGQRVGYEYVLWTFFIHRDIAELTKTSRQTVTTTLNKLKRKNIIEFNRRRLLVRDMEQLKKEGIIPDEAEKKADK